MPTTAKYTIYGQVTFLEKVGAMALVMLLRESCLLVALFTNFEPHPQRHQQLSCSVGHSAFFRFMRPTGTRPGRVSPSKRLLVI